MFRYLNLQRRFYSFPGEYRNCEKSEMVHVKGPDWVDNLVKSRNIIKLYKSFTYIASLTLLMEKSSIQSRSLNGNYRFVTHQKPISKTPKSSCVCLQNSLVSPTSNHQLHGDVSVFGVVAWRTSQQEASKQNTAASPRRRCILLLPSCLCHRTYD